VDAISKEDFLLNKDEFDADESGISGKTNYVWKYTTNLNF
jgi:CxxC motif-containing protein (DUF1111 family)